MALTYTSFNSFKEVEERYNKTKPLRGKDNAGKDIRPIGDRKRKWERIVKIDNNCYALSDGHHYGDEHFPVWSRTAKHTPTLKDMEKYAPIVWRRHKDGTEEVTMRNGWGPGTHTTRYQFLYRHSPKGLWFRNRNGKHFIQVASTGASYFLAKVRTTPRPVYEEIKNDSTNSGWINNLKTWVQLQDDNSALTFKRTENGWVFVNGGKPIPVPPKQRVDKNAKAKLKEHIAAFREWALAIGPMLPIHDYNYEKTLRDGALLWLEGNGEKPIRYWNLDGLMNSKLSRQIIADDEHPLRLQLAYLALARRELLRECEDEDDVKKVKAAFNRWINKQLGLVKEVKG
jgi:hypothetical protein